MKKIEEGYDIIEKKILINKILKMNKEKNNFVGKKGIFILKFQIKFKIYFIFVYF